MLKARLEKDFQKALKENAEIKISTLRLLKATILNEEKEKRYQLTKIEPELKEEELIKKSSLTDEELIKVVFSEIKKRREAILEFKKGNRQDLVNKETKEIQILKKYLPEQISEKEIKKIAKGTIKKVGAKGLRDMGKVMSELMPDLRSKAEGSLVSKIVRELLSAYD